MRATWVLRLYPSAWRERYEDEMIAVLEQHEPTLITLFDLLLGALDARLDPNYWRERFLLPMERIQRIRIAATWPLWIFPFFFIVSFVVMRGDDSWQYLKEINSIAAIVYAILYAGEGLAFWSILIVDLVMSALLAVYAVRNNPRHRLQKALPLVPLAFIGVMLASAFIRGIFDWLGTELSVPLILPPLIAVVIAKSVTNETVLRIAVVSSVLVTLTMLLTLVGLVVLQLVAVSLLPDPVWPLQLLPGILAITFVLVLTCRALWRGLKTLAVPSIGADAIR